MDITIIGAPTPRAGIPWFDLVQTLGIVVGFGLTWWQLRQASKLTRLDIFWRIGDSHRAVWAPLLANPAFNRVLSRAPDLRKDPITEQERFFVIHVTHHVGNVFAANLQGYYKLGAPDERDIGETFNFPIFQAIWSELRPYQPANFVAFIDRVRTQHPASLPTTASNPPQ